MIDRHQQLVADTDLKNVWIDHWRDQEIQAARIFSQASPRHNVHAVTCFNLRRHQSPPFNCRINQGQAAAW
jgi:hypothetical protein